jgi:cell division protein FtsB
MSKSGRSVHPLFLLLSLALFLYVSGIGLKNIFRYNTFKLEHKALLAEVEQERRKQLLYQSKLARIRQISFWEEEAKLKLGLVKQGEVVYQFIEPAPLE